MSKTSNKKSDNSNANNLLANSPYHSQKRLSMVAENYLLSIYNLQENNENKISLTELAEYLKNAPVSENLGSSLPSVSAMIKRLIKEGLLTSNAKDLELSVGFSHPVIFKGIEGVEIKVPDQNSIIVEGSSKSEETQLASDIAIHVYEMAKLSIGGLENKDIAAFQTRNAEVLGKLMQKSL